MSLFKPATRRKLKLRMAIDGPSGSGKTYTALRAACGLVAGNGDAPDGRDGRIAVIDTEHRAASKYLGEAPDGVPWQFDVCELSHFAPSTYTAAIREAGAAGYGVLIIDSLSHAWEGVGGALDLVDRKAEKTGNSFTAWKDVTPLHRELIEAILACPCHVIATMRTKMEYAIEKDEKGKTAVKKLGMAPVQRAGMEYEFDVVADMDETHTLTVSKTRCPALDGLRVVRPTQDFVRPLRGWLDAGEANEPAVAEPVAQAPTPAVEEIAADAANARPNPAAGETLRDGEPVPRYLLDEMLRLGESIDLPAEVLKRMMEARGASRLSKLSVAGCLEITEKLRQKARRGWRASAGPSGRKPRR